MIGVCEKAVDFAKGPRVDLFRGCNGDLGSLKWGILSELNDFGWLDFEKLL